MTTHYLKTDPEVFQLTWDDKKPWEIRYNDRDYKVGDTLVLKETQISGEEMARDCWPVLYTGRQIISTVTATVSGYGLEEDWVVMTAMPIEKVINEVKP